MSRSLTEGDLPLPTSSRENEEDQVRDTTDPVTEGVQEAVETFREELRRQNRYLSRQKMLSIMVETGLYMFFIFLFTIITYTSRDDQHAYFFSAAVTDRFTGEEFDQADSHVRKTFYDIANMDDWWAWLQGPFLSNMLEEEWYNGDPYSEEEKKFVLGYFRIVGAIRLRQLRVRPNSCDVNQIFAKVIPHCYYQYNPYTEDRSCFGPNCTYVWRSPQQLQDTPYFWGRLSVYDGSGFVVDLKPNRTAVTSTLRELKAQRWIDWNTRAVFVDFTLYNANLNLFSVVRLSTEFPSSGGIVPSHVVRTVKIWRYTKQQDFVVLIFEIAILAMLLFYSVQQVYLLFTEKRKYFTQIWRYIDMLNIIIFGVVIFYRLRVLFTVYFQLNFNPAVYDFYNFEGIARDIDSERNFNSFNAVLIWLKIFKYLRFSKKMNQLARVLGKAALNIIVFMIMFFIVFLGFSQAFFIAFGVDIKQYRDVIHSSYSLMLTIFGDFDFESLEGTNRVLGPVLFFSFMVLVTFVLLNMFLAIINDAFHEIQNEDGNDELDIVASLKNFFLGTKRVGEIARDLETADVNDDKVIDQEELKNFMKKNTDAGTLFGVKTSSELMNQYDDDQDGVLSHSEVAGMKSRIQDIRKGIEAAEAAEHQKHHHSFHNNKSPAGRIRADSTRSVRTNISTRSRSPPHATLLSPPSSLDLTAVVAQMSAQLDQLSEAVAQMAEKVDFEADLEEPSLRP
jgi:hypothetical protein